MTPPGPGPDQVPELSQEQALGLMETLALVAGEYRRAVALHPRWASAHEGIALLFEEIWELWDEVRKRRDARDLDAMRREAIQVAAMAVRFVEEICRPEIAGRGEGMVS